MTLFYARGIVNLKLIFPSQFYSTAREARFLKKLMIGTSKSRRKWFTVDQTPSKALKDFNFLGSGGVVPAEKRQKSGKVTRRVSVLNTVFMDHITSLLATGETGIDVIGLGLEISRVQMSSDFSFLMVYWVASGTEKDDVLNSILEKTAFTLRHKLSQLRVIGYIPVIKFAKDEQFSKLMEVQKLLEIADYGEDFIPTNIGHHLKPPIPIVPSSTISPYLRAKIEEFDFETNSGESSDDDSEKETGHYIFDENIMRQDILGLNHAVMMDKVMDALTRITFKRNALAQPPSPVELVQAVSETPMTGEQALEQTQQDKRRTIEFLEFLKTRRLEKSKEMKRLNAMSKEKEFYEDELRESMFNAESSILEKEGDFMIEDEDYIVDEEITQDELIK